MCKISADVISSLTEEKTGKENRIPGEIK